MNTLEDTIGNTPLVKLQRMTPANGSEIWVKLEGNNPAGSVKDRAALSMIVQAEKRGEIKPGDVLIEATSGNTGIALAMIAALKGYRLKLLMPDNMSQERRAAMRAYGAELILVSKAQGMEGARDLALDMARRGEGKLLDQFNNPDNPYAHYTTTGPEIWQQTGGRLGALRVAKAAPGAVVVAIICDRGDRYLSTGVFGEESYSQGSGI
ncbi:MAG: cysM [Enterobacter kobei]|nr:cysM [Enterobacter kobei]